MDVTYIHKSLQNGSADTSNFDEEFTREQPTLTPVHGQLSSRDQAEFNGFSWVSKGRAASDSGRLTILSNRWLIGQIFEKTLHVVNRFSFFTPIVL